MPPIPHMHSYEPSQGHGLAHDPFNAIVAPRPIGWISTRDADGQLNLAPYSFFNAFLYTPPIVGFSSVGWKDSVRNADATREFVWNLVTRDLDTRMNVTSAPLAPGESEFAAAGLTPVGSRVVGVPRVGEARAAMECKVVDVIQHKSAAGVPADGWLVLGEVVAVHIDETLIVDGVYQTALARPILRAGRAGDYFEVSEGAMFEMERPKGAPRPA
jgi:flavin reductase (DIM6/NTAB) family NADH-FMN oxidoreductase RutF